MKKVCAQCSKTFDAATVRVKLCSRECVNKWLLGRKKKSKANQKSKQVIEKQCEYCGNIFTVDGLKHHKDKKFCSRNCMYKAQKKRENIHCAYCGKEFYPYDKDARYCSLSCSSRAQAPGKWLKIQQANAEVWEARRRETEIKKEAERQEKQLKKEEAQRQAYISWMKKARQGKMRFSVCEWCGCDFINDRADRKYCSVVCRNRACNKRGEITRRQRIVENTLENVSLEELYKRDAGACHICGGQCRYDDYTVVGDVFIAGNYYPSIDHIIPLAKGGEHSYDNVRLAHRICNARRGTKELTK